MTKLRHPNNIRTLRRARSPTWRQADLARRIGVSPSDLGKYERGERVPSLPMALRICHVLCKPLEQVFWGLRDLALVQVYRLEAERVEVNDPSEATLEVEDGEQEPFSHTRAGSPG